LKLLRGEYLPKVVSKSGAIHILKAYYSQDEILLKSFEDYLIANESTVSKKTLRDYYEKNRIDYVSKKSVSHFMLLSIELKRVLNGGKTKLLLQFDQVASGLVFIALLWKNQELGEKTNIMNGNDVGGPYHICEG
jgi:hypothetical protein